MNQADKKNFSTIKLLAGTNFLSSFNPAFFCTFTALLVFHDTAVFEKLAMSILFTFALFALPLLFTGIPEHYLTTRYSCRNVVTFSRFFECITAIAAAAILALPDKSAFLFFLPVLLQGIEYAMYRPALKCYTAEMVPRHLLSKASALTEATTFFGIAAGVSFAFFDITACDIFVLIMIPAAVTVCICDTLNSFIPLIGIILTVFCITARMIAQCLTEGAFWPLLTFAVGGIFGFAIMMLINFLSVKFGAKKADRGNIILVTMLWASSGIFGGALILAAAELAAILFYILPNYIIAKKQKRPVPFSEIRYPLSPFLFICYCHSYPPIYLYKIMNVHTNIS